jgi:hypothetical protein
MAVLPNPPNRIKSIQNQLLTCHWCRRKTTAPHSSTLGRKKMRSKYQGNIVILLSSVLLLVGSGQAHSEKDQRPLSWDIIQDTGGVSVGWWVIRKIDRTFVKIKYDVSGKTWFSKKPRRAIGLKVTEIQWESHDWNVVIHIIAESRGEAAKSKETEYYFEATALPPGEYKVYYGEIKQERYIGSFTMKAPNKANSADEKSRAAD